MSNASRLESRPSKDSLTGIVGKLKLVDGLNSEWDTAYANYSGKRLLLESIVQLRDRLLGSKIILSSPD